MTQGTSQTRLRDGLGYGRACPTEPPVSETAKMSLSGVQALLRTFADGLVFLLAIPIAEGLEMLQTSSLIPTIANLP